MSHYAATPLTNLIALSATAPYDGVDLYTAVDNQWAALSIDNAKSTSVAVVPNGSETIQGAAGTLTLAANSAMTIYSNGTGWRILSTYNGAPVIPAGWSTTGTGASGLFLGNVSAAFSVGQIQWYSTDGGALWTASTDLSTTIGTVDTTTAPGFTIVIFTPTNAYFGPGVMFCSDNGSGSPLVPNGTAGPICLAVQ